MARRHSSGRRRAESVRRSLLPHRRTLRVEPLEARLCLSAAQLIGHWSFDNDDVSGDTIVDSAGGFDGMKTNGGPATGMAGVVGEAADFAGGENNSKSHFADLGSHAGTFGTLATGTISAWVKPSASAPTDVLTIFSVSNSGAASEEMRFFVSNGGAFGVGELAYGVRAGTMIGNIVSTSADLFDGAWHHVAVTVGAGNDAQIYIDGQPANSGNISFLTDLMANAAAIGRNLDNANMSGGQWFFGGDMDDVGLWNDALTAAEVRALFNLAQHPQLNYDLGQAEQLFNLSDLGSGTVEIDGLAWTPATGLGGPVGEIVAEPNGRHSLNLGGGNGVQSRFFVVDSTADLSDTSIGDGICQTSTGECTLRAAIEEAGTQSDVSLIRFDPSLSGSTIELGFVNLLINSSLTIDATNLAGGITIDAGDGDDDVAGTGDGFQVLNVTDNNLNSIIDVTLKGLTLTGGDLGGTGSIRGGAITSSENLTIVDTAVIGNHTSDFQGFGGGINSTHGDLTLIRSTVSGNSTSGSNANGGGIHNLLGTLTLIDSTISDNSTSGANALGGGVASLQGNTVISNSTISGNSIIGRSGGGVRSYLGDLTVANSTITENAATDGFSSGGGIHFRTGALTLDGNIVAGNSANSAADIEAGSVSATGSYNLIGDGSGISITGSGNQIGSAANPIDPRLGPLADNGGPTHTHALFIDSPAIDTGDPNFTPPPDFDQRGTGFARVLDGNGDGTVTIDIGAFELKALFVDTLADESDDDFSSGDFSLREAIEEANASAGADLIAFAASLSGGTIPLTEGQMTIGDSLTIDATPLAAPVRIDAQQNSRIFDISGGANNFDVTIAGLTLTDGQMSGDNEIDGFAFNGGAIRSLTSGTLAIKRSRIIDSHVVGDFTRGGGVFTDMGELYLENSTLSVNTAEFGGGAIAGGANAAITLAQSTVSGNTAVGFGGGIHALNDVNLDRSTVSGNDVTFGNGGGLYALGSATLNHSTVSGNSAAGDGGGIVATSATLAGSLVANNTAGSSGPDLFTGTAAADYSLIGDAQGLNITGTGNIVGDSTGSGIVDPLLGPLADNGGPTLTHALLHGSPAIDAGDPDFMPPPNVDQRGLARVADGGVNGVRIDIGAYEAQAPPPTLPGDYNQNAVVDAADYVLWRRMLGDTGVTPFSGSDGNGDGEITSNDFGVWTANFGDSLAGAGSGAAAAAAVDEAMALHEQAEESAPLNTNASDLNPATNDIAILLDSVTSPLLHVAKPRLPNIERSIRTAAVRADLLLVLSPADEAPGDEPTGPLRLSPEMQLAVDHNTAPLVASDVWFTTIGNLPS